jgi:hypothetical protein
VGEGLGDVALTAVVVQELALVEDGHAALLELHQAGRVRVAALLGSVDIGDPILVLCAQSVERLELLGREVELAELGDDGLALVTAGVRRHVQDTGNEGDRTEDCSGADHRGFISFG